MEPAEKTALTADDLTEEWFLAASGFLAEHHQVELMPSAHWHDHFELNLLIDGAMTYLFNGRRVTLAEGRLYCFWAAIPHQVISAEADANLVCVYVPFADFLSLSMPDGFKNEVMAGQILAARQADAIDPAIFRRWAEDWQLADEPLEQILRDEVRLRIKRLALAAERAGPEQTASGKDMAGSRLTADRRAIDRVQAMTTFINTEFGGAIGVENIARAGGLHPTNANASFRKVLGMSISQYLRRRRLSQAMRLLAETDDAIIEVAFSCGYGSLSRFYDAFQQQVTCTPRAYRQRFRG